MHATHPQAPAAQPAARLQDGLVQLQPRSTPSGFKQTYSDKDNGPVKVTLHDCLACSGCVTSAETVLLQHQSIEELEQQLARPEVHVVVTVSPQSRASLAGVYVGEGGGAGQPQQQPAALNKHEPLQHRPCASTAQHGYQSSTAAIGYR
jgi:hypothetical protein